MTSLSSLVLSAYRAFVQASLMGTIAGSLSLPALAQSETFPPLPQPNSSEASSTESFTSPLESSSTELSIPSSVLSSIKSFIPSSAASPIKSSISSSEASPTEPLPLPLEAEPHPILTPERSSPHPQQFPPTLLSQPAPPQPDSSEPSPSQPDSSPLNPPQSTSPPTDPTPPSAPPLHPSTHPPIHPSTLTPTLLTPTPNTLLEVPATTVVLQFPIGSEVILRVNGDRVDASLIGRTVTDAATNLVTQTWYGVGLKEGQNTITAGIAGGGSTSVQVRVRGVATELTVEPVEPSVPADRRSIATIQGELLDESGNRANQDALITLEVSDGEWVGTDARRDQPGFQVQAQQGQYTARLRSSLDANVVRIRATSGDLEAFTQVEFETALRPTLMAGVVNLRLGARGTNFFGSLRDFLPADGDNSTEFNVSGAVFLTTPIGEWQFTGAFNSDRPLNQNCNGNNALFRAADDCDQVYPTYGDGSTTDVITPSTDQVYLRLERSSPVEGAGSDFVMWGDYTTGDQFATRSQFYTATNRDLHGAFANYNLGNLQITGFYANNVEGFQRDTIAPDGTSGFYFLSRRLLVPGSENVFIETEEFNRPGTVLQSQQLARGVDYEIDYDRGTLLFNRPILRTGVDEQGRVFVRRIVVTYQYEGGEDTDIFGGRVRYHLSRDLNRESWVGATYVQENQGNRDFRLYGADALISFGENGQLIAEYARSEHSSDIAGQVSGSAYRVEAQTTLFDRVQARAFYRSTDPGFANNATTSFVPGQTRYGVDLQTQLSPTTSLRTSYDHEDNFGIAPRVLNDFDDLINPGTAPRPGNPVDNSLTTVVIGVEQRIGQATLGIDWIHRDREDRISNDDLENNLDDDLENDLSETSSQLRSRLTVPIIRDVTFRAQNELNLSGDDSRYPDRTILGLDWQVTPGITLSLNQQFFETESGSNAITSLDFSGEYKPWTGATLNGRFSMLMGYGMAGTIGLQQGIQLAPGLQLTLAYERVFASEFNTTGAGAQFPQPYAVGQGASALGIEGGDSYSVGLEYTANPDFQANARFEHRTSSQGSNTVIIASALGRVTPELTALLNFQHADSANQRLPNLGPSTTLRFGLVYRDPEDDRFNALLRYEYRRNPSTIPDALLFSTGTGSEEHLFAAEAIYAPNWRWEFYGKFAIRSSTSYLASDLIGTSTIALTQLRATYRLGYRWDAAAEVRWITQPTAGYDELGASIEVGYYLTPQLRLSAGYSFGSVDDRDFDGSRSASGPYLGVTLKLDNSLFRDFGVRENAQENVQETAQDNAQENAQDDTSVQPSEQTAEELSNESSQAIGDSPRERSSAPLTLAPLNSNSSHAPLQFTTP